MVICVKMVTNVIKIVAKNVRDFFAELLIQVSMAELMSVFGFFCIVGLNFCYASKSI